MVGGGSKLLNLYHKMNNNNWVEKIKICVFHVVKYFWKYYKCLFYSNFHNKPVSFYTFALSATISPPFSPYMTLLATQNRKQVKCKLDIMIMFVIIFTCLLVFYPQT